MLTVLNVSYPLAPVTESTAGGAEQIVGILDAGIVAAGERSLLLAPAGSNTCGKLLASAPVGPTLTNELHSKLCREYKYTIERALREFPVDVVHLHGVDFNGYIPDCSVPLVVTLHLPPQFYPRETFYSRRKNLHLICVSPSQARECPEGSNVYDIISNGVPTFHSDYPRAKGNYVLCMGRICPEKGYHLALDAATACGVPLVLAGTVFGYGTHQEYFDSMILPRLNPPHKFVGAVGGKQKRRLLAGARCLVVPSLVNETSCLVAMEAMACGTPVVGFRRGALADVIEHERTGFLVDSPSQFPDAINATQYLSASLCQETAERRFNSRRMVDQYLALYRKLTDAYTASREEFQRVA
jgi:glycosyltransferase involved in cell wall biosynthesis